MVQTPEDQFAATTAGLTILPSGVARVSVLGGAACALLERQLFILRGFSKTGKKTDKVPESEKRIARHRRDILIKRFQEAEKQATGNEKQTRKPQKSQKR